MNREKTLQYFKQLGFKNSTSKSYGQRLYMMHKELLRMGNCSERSSHGEPDENPIITNLEKFERAEKRMKEIQLSRSPYQAQEQTFDHVPVCTTCNCSQTDSTLQPLRTLNSTAHSVQDDAEELQSDSDSESDHELSLERLLSMMSRMCNQRDSKASTAILRMTTIFTLTASLTEEHIKQISEFLDCDHSLVKEASLMVLEQLLELGWGWKLVDHVTLLHQIINLTIKASKPSIHIRAMRVLDKMLNVSNLDFIQLQGRLKNEVYPSMLEYLRGKASLDVKYVACCVIRTLACDLEVAGKFKKDGLFVLQRLQCHSAMLRKAYVGILVALVAHCGLTEVGNVDTWTWSAIKGLLRDGPCEVQKCTLSLLYSIMTGNNGVEAVAYNCYITTHLTACLLSSQCRQVRTQACLVFATLTSLRKASVAHAVLEGISDYMEPEDAVQTVARGNCTDRLIYPVPARNQAEVHMWQNLDIFLDKVLQLIQTEGLLVKENGKVSSELPLKGEISDVQVSVLNSLVQLAINFCLWPVQRKTAVPVKNAEIDRLDLTYLCDDLSVVETYSALNIGLALQQWKRFGAGIFALFSWLSRRVIWCVQSVQAEVCGQKSAAGFCQKMPEDSNAQVLSQQSFGKLYEKNNSSSSPSQSSFATTSPLLAKEILSEAEWLLLNKLLSFVLCMALASCKTIPNPISENSCSPITSSSARCSKQGQVSKQAELAQSQEERKKEASRKAVRRGMYNKGLFSLLSSLLQLADLEIKMLCILILRAAVQPLEMKQKVVNKQVSLMTEPTSDKVSYTSYGHSTHACRTLKGRPLSAHVRSIRNSDKVPNSAVHTLSSASFSSPRSITPQKQESILRATSSSDFHLSCRDVVRCQHSNTLVTPDLSTSGSSQLNTLSSPLQLPEPLDGSHPISMECQREAVQRCGAHIIHSLFSCSPSVKFCSLVLLHDLVKFTTVEMHMELSKNGIVPKLLDFIRISNDNGQLTVLALSIIRMLITSDMRLKQLFFSHGGIMLLVALTKSSNANICEHVKVTFAAITGGQTSRGDYHKVKGLRPVTAPSFRRIDQSVVFPSQPSDIWDQIMFRWAQEDRVVQVLQKFM